MMIHNSMLLLDCYTVFVKLIVVHWAGCHVASAGYRNGRNSSTGGIIYKFYNHQFATERRQ